MNQCNRYKRRSSISKAQSYEEIAEFWDTHDLAGYWYLTHPLEFEVDIQFEVVIKACGGYNSMVE